MKMVEMLMNQKMIVQLLYGENKIEFSSKVVENDGLCVYVSPYLHNESPLELNVTQNKGVICNIFTDSPGDQKRISWKNVELTSVIRKGEMVYCLKTNGFNDVANPDDRRVNSRIVIHLNGKLSDGKSDEEIAIIVHDISATGISFYAPTSFTPQTGQLFVSFSDVLNGKVFNLRVECSMARTANKAGNTFYGCKVTGENKDYLMYMFVKHLVNKNN